MMLGGVGQGFSVVSFRLNPVVGEDGGLEAIGLTDFSYSDFDLRPVLIAFPVMNEPYAISTSNILSLKDSLI